MIQLVSVYLPYALAGVCFVLFLLTLVILLVTRHKQKHTTAVASKQAAFLHRIFNTSPQPILVIDHAGRILDSNVEFQTLVGYAQKELSGQSILLIAPSLVIQDLVNEILAPTSVEVEIVLKSGEKKAYILFLSPFSQEKQHFFTIMAKNPQDLNAIEKNSRHALDVIQSRMDELFTIRRVSEDLNQATTLKGALSSVLETIRSITKSQKVWLFLPNYENNICLRVDYDALNSDGPMVFSINKDCSGKCLSALLSGELDSPRRIDSCRCLESSTVGEKEISAHYALPLYVGKKPIGVLNFIDDERYPITENKLDLLHTIGDSLSVAIERVRLFKIEHDQRNQAETLRDIGVNLTKSLDLSEVLDLLLIQLLRLVPYDGGNVMVISDNITQVDRSKGYNQLSAEQINTLKSLNFNINSTHNLRVMYEERHALIVPDTHKDPNWIVSEISPKFHAWLGAPVVIDGKVEAFFSLDNEEPGSFTSDQAALLTAFASQAALSIKNAKLYLRELRRIQELDGLQATLSGVTSELDINVLLKQIVKRAITLCNASLGELGLYEPSHNALRIVVSENLDQNYVGNLIKVGEGLMGRVAENLKPLAITDYKHWEGKLEKYKDLVPHAGLAVPMVVGNELIGVIGVGDINYQRHFTQDDTRLLESFAQQAIIAIQNARLFQDAKKRAEESEKLIRAGAVVASTLDQTEAIDRILEQLSFVVPYDSASVLLRKENHLVIVGGRGFKDSYPILGREYELDQKNPGATVYLKNEPYYLNDVTNSHPDFSKLPQADHPIKSWLGVPLTIKGQPIGILSLDAYETGRFTEEYARLVKAFADQVSIALENARLFTEEVQSAARFKTLYTISQIISANLNLEEIYPAIYQAVTQLMRTEFFSIALVDRENAIIRDVYMVDRDEPVELGFRGIDQGLFAKVIKEGKPRIYNSFDNTALVESGAVLIGDTDMEDVSQSVLIVPLKTGSGIIGVLSAQSYTPNMYSAEDMETLELLASNVAIAIENAQLFDKVQSMAITDHLTGLYNRRKFYEYASQEFERSRRYQRPLSVIMLDIDHFKKVNDSYGHAIGDQVLQGLALLAKTNLRQVDILARYGGEEFVILLPETSLEEALLIAERLRSNTAAATIPTRVGNMAITISLGVAAQDETCRNLEELLDRSDQAQYVSKRTGRDKVTNWQPEYSTRLPGTGPLPTIKPNHYI